MRIMRYFLCLTSVILMCAGCKDDDVKSADPPPSTKLDGVYDVVSITCDYPIDLDRDGKQSFDLLEETHEIKNASRYYAEFKTVIYHWEPDYYDQEVDVWVPLTYVFHDKAGNFQEVQYSFTNLLAVYHFDETSNQVAILRNLGNGEVAGGRLITEDTLFIQFKAYFYSTKGWEKLPLNGTYKRRP